MACRAHGLRLLLFFRCKHARQQLDFEYYYPKGSFVGGSNLLRGAQLLDTSREEIEVRSVSISAAVTRLAQDSHESHLAKSPPGALKSFLVPTGSAVQVPNAVRLLSRSILVGFLAE